MFSLRVCNSVKSESVLSYLFSYVSIFLSKSDFGNNHIFERAEDFPTFHCNIFKISVEKSEDRLPRNTRNKRKTRNEEIYKRGTHFADIRLRKINV